MLVNFTLGTAVLKEHGEHKFMTGMINPEEAPAAFQAAWNGHDMDALGDLFHQDATFVNRFGHYVHGIEEIVAPHVPFTKRSIATLRFRTS